MAGTKSVHDDVLDAAFNRIKSDTNFANKLTIVSAACTNYTEANSTYKLAEIAMTSGDYTIADGDVSGRKVTVATKSSVPVTTQGSANGVCLVATTDTKLLYQTTCTTQTIYTTSTVNVQQWDIEIADPS